MKTISANVYLLILSIISAGSAAELTKQYEPGGRMVKIATFEELKAATTNPNILIIDVREPHELQETGVVPNSINIPLATVKDVLATSPGEDFKKTFGKDKPDLDSEIIFTCRSGKRSAAAYAIAEDLGYKNLKNFDGGWLLWESKIKQ